MSTSKQEAARTRTELAPTGSSSSDVVRRNHSALFLLTVFAVGVGVVAWVIRDVRGTNVEVQRIYAGAVLGLLRIGELQYDAQETRRSTLYALTTSDGNLQVDYADQSREADRRVTEGISLYLNQARDPREIALGKRLATDWPAYLGVRNEVLGLILESSSLQAIDLDLREGVPSFDRVRFDLQEIKRLYEEQATHGLETVATSSHRSVVKLIAVLGFGLLFTSISVWAIEKSKTFAAVQTARLQMDFVASVSHDLRTPLAAILSASQNIADGFAQNLPLYSSMITTQTRKLIDLVDQILLFTSMKAVKQQYCLRPLRVAEVFEDVRKNTLWMFEQDGFSVDFRVPEALPLVLGDLEGLSRCLQNLIGNGVKYGGNSKRIEVYAQFLETGVRGKEITISVKDQGLGISLQERKQIFEPFYRSPRVRSAQIRGTGLGLSVAKHLVEAMEGKISVTSEVGVGSVFTLHLPIADESCLTAVAAAQRAVTST